MQHCFLALYMSGYIYIFRWVGGIFFFFFFGRLLLVFGWSKPGEQQKQTDSKNTTKVESPKHTHQTHTTHTHTLTQAEKQTQSLQHFFAWQPPNCNINRLAKVS